MMTILQFKKPQPGNSRNGECYAIESPRVEYRGNDEIVVSIDYGVVHMSASGNSAGYYGGYATMAEAEAAARQEARRRDCVLISGGGA